MLKKYWVQSLIAAVISITVVGSVITHENKIATTATVSDVWVNDCDTPVQRPQSLTLTCADGGMRLEELIWAVWDKSGAVGYGTYLENDCQPSCAEGTYSKTPVYVTLGGITQSKRTSFLKTLVIRPDEGRELPKGHESISWSFSE